MKRILVPTDFSETAENAVNVALEIAQKAKATVYFFHTVNTAINWGITQLSVPGKPISVQKQKEMYPEVNKQIADAQAKLSELSKRAAKMKVDSKIELGNNLFHEDLGRFADKNKIDLIVMGTHGVSGVKEAFLGSNTLKIIRTSNVPVLTVKHKHKSFKIKSLIYASDFEETKANKNIERVKAFADFFGASIHFVYVNTPVGFEDSAYTMAKIHKIAKDNKIAKYYAQIYNDFTVERGLANVAEMIETDMLTLSTHGYTGFRHFINNNVAENVANHARVPVLTFRMK
jgi:nucleotide-binding universal stress UspA family protein